MTPFPPSKWSSAEAPPKTTGVSAFVKGVRISESAYPKPPQTPPSSISPLCHQSGYFPSSISHLPSSRVPTRKKGFSLIEILVAVAIAGMAFFVLTQAFVNTLMAIGSLKVQSNHEPHIRFARAQILTEPDLETFEEGGEVTSLGLGQIDWEAYVEETTVLDLFRVELTMRIENPDDSPYELTETLYLLRPNWSDPIDRSILLDESRSQIEDQRLFTDW